MKYFVMVILMVMTFSVNACRVYTDEQYDVLTQAYMYGHEYNYGYTLAAIVRKEAFVGDKIIRLNPSDPSFGITHIQTDTAMHLLPRKMSRWEKLEYIEDMMTNDQKAFELSIKKLQSVKAETFWSKWKAYNGAGQSATKYANDIRKIIAEYRECGIFEPFKGWG